MDPSKWLNKHGPLAGLHKFIGTEDHQKSENPGCLNSIRPIVWIVMASFGMGALTMCMGN